MWDDIIIGGNENGRGRGTSSIRVDGSNRISENDIAYWICGCVFQTGMTIYKNTDEGKHLSKMIKEGEEWAAIDDWLDNIVLKMVDISYVRKALIDVRNDGIKEGKYQKIREIRNALDYDR